MAFWGAPEPVKNHPQRALVAAARCVERLGELQEEWRARGLPELDCRIGINTGHALCGNFGSKSRLNYTVIGDTVNLAARLESLCKQFGVQTLFSADTVRQAGFSAFIPVRPLGRVQVVGKSQDTEIFSLINLPEATEEVCLELLKIMDAGIMAFSEGRFADAAHEFKMYMEMYRQLTDKEDPACQFYLNQCTKMIVRGVPPGWNGVLVMDEK